MEADPEALAAIAAAVPTTEEVDGTPNLGEPSRAEGAEEANAEGGEDDEEAVVSRAQRLIDKILETQNNPNPRHMHALATILEAQEAKYLQESTGPSFNNTRASHTIGRLGNLARDNDEFYESISSKFLTESRYPVSVRAASARLLLSASSSWMYPHVFDDAVLDNIKIWVREDRVVSDNECIWKHELGANKPTDTELLRTYATGLLALSLVGGGQVVEDILTSGLSAKLMHYLHIRILGDASSHDTTFPSETKHSSLRSREQYRGRTRLVSNPTRLEGAIVCDEGFLVNQSVCLDSDMNVVSRQVHGDDYWGGNDSLKSELTDSSSEATGVYETVDDNAAVATGDGCHDDKYRHGDRLVAAKSIKEEDTDESIEDELSKRRVNRGLQLQRSRLKVKMDDIVESDRALTSPSGLRLGSNIHDSRDKTEDKKMGDTKDNLSRTGFDSLFDRDDKDDRTNDCIFGTSDVSEMVTKAIKAAEAEARAAGAPLEAIKAAGDAAAELVKGAAMEAWKSTNDEAAVVLAASEAASTVVDAAIATELSLSANQPNEDSTQLNYIEAKSVEQMEDFIILDAKQLANLREKYCIQCLEILGEYVEALGPILHEKGVDVCLALLHNSIEVRTPENIALLPEVLKLICALAAHRKFAALFVDRGGMQKLLSVQRVQQTFFGLSSCLFTIGSLQGIMERVCALPSDVVNQIVELALQLLECSQEQARKNAAIFFAAAFVFRAVIDSFDAQEGLHKMLDLLHGAASVRSGGNPGSLGAPNSTLRNDRSAPEVLTASEKQIAYHTCVALRQYFRAHLLLLVDSLRPNKSSRSIARNAPSARPAYKPLDISNEAMDAVFVQIQRDRKIGPAFVRARWPAVDKFLSFNGHITMLELCQASPVDRYLHDLAQYALGIIHLITFVPYSRKLIVNATLSNNRFGMAVILDVANGAGYVGPEVIHPALNVLVNLVCPPPSISNKPSPVTHGQQTVPIHTLAAAPENRERHPERNISGVPLSLQNELRERNVESHSVERTSATAISAATSSNPQTPTSAVSGVVGDRRISLGPGAGCAGLAAQLEQGYRQAREAVRANNGIKVILHLLHPRMITPPAALDCIRALACRVLLGLARDDAIAHILTKLQVGKKLSELIRDSGCQASGTEQGRWQSELAQVAIELIAIVTNSGRASTLAATDAAAPTLRRIERAAIAAATPVTYHSRELLQLIHEHLQASGFMATAALLQKEADITPFPSSGVPHLALHQTPLHENSFVQLHWPSGRVSAGFGSNLTKTTTRDEDTGGKSDFTPRKKLQASSSSFSHGKYQLSRSSTIKPSSTRKSPRDHGTEIVSPSASKSTLESRTPILLPMKRKFMESREPSSTSAFKRIATSDLAFQSPVSQVLTFGRRNLLSTDPAGMSPIIDNSSHESNNRTTLSNMVADNSDDVNNHSTPGLLTSVSQPGMPADLQPGNTERMTLDSLVVQYLKHQHRQCPAPITTLPPLSLMHPHVCPEPSHGLNAPANVTARIGTREFRKQYGGIHAHRRDRQFIYSRFKPFRSCRDDTALFSCITFLGDSSRIATGGHSGEIKIFDTNNGNVMESQLCHQTPVTTVKSAFTGSNQLLLSSGSYDVKLWDASSISGGPLHSFEACKAAHFSHTGANFAALSADISRRDVLLYDVQTCNVDMRLPDSSNGVGTVRGHTSSLIHFNPSDTMILWNGILWDRRNVNAVHRFDQFTDYGGGGFHPSGNEVIINSEVWDIRKFKLLRTVPSLDQTVITFNGAGDIIYAILRRNIEDITSAVNTRRVRHPLFSAFRTIDAVNYSDIATVQVDRCVLDFAKEPTDSLVGVIAMDDHEDMFSSARLYEVGRKRPTDDDSDPDDDGESDESDEDDENDESEEDVDPILGVDLEGDDSNSDNMTNDNDIDDDMDSADGLDEDGDFTLEDFEGDQGFLDFIAEAEEGDEDDLVDVESVSSEDEGWIH